jgi:hypothetical protein
MAETLETRIAFLEQVLDAHVKLNAILFPIILQHDEQFRAKAAETLRQILVSPAMKLSPLLEQQIRILRDVLVLPIPQEVVESCLQPSIRPVE